MEKEIELEQEAIVVYSGGGAVSSVNGYTGDVVLTTSDLENTSDYQTGTEVESAISTAIAGKQDTLTAGNNITISNNTISATNTTYSAGTGLTLSGTQFSVNTGTIATKQNVSDEATARENADINLQGQIDAISAASDVTDIVGTYAALQAYDTTHLKDNDIIKVLQDESQDDETTYYRWSTSTHTFTLIGEEGPYYTKSQADTLLNAKQNTLTAGSNVQIVNDTISATDTTYTAGTGLALNGTQFSVDTTAIATQSDLTAGLATKQDTLTAGTNIQINNNTISATDTTYSAFTGTDGQTAGTSGLVPAPTTSDTGKFLKADGTWDVAGGGGAEFIELTTADYNWNSSTGQTGTPNCVALWLLPSGIYKGPASTSIEVRATRTQDYSMGAGFSSYAIVKECENTNTNRAIVTYVDGANGNVVEYYSIDENGQNYSTKNFPNVVQTTGTSTTNVMSQNATTGMIFDDPGNLTRIRFGKYAECSSSYESVGIGYNGKGTGYGSIGIMGNASGNRSIAFGVSANATARGAVAFPGSTANVQGTFAISVGDTSIGYNNTYYRLLTGVHDGAGDHDAATYGQLNGRIKQNAGAPTTSTVGTIGQLLEDTTNGKLYICTDATNPYVWEEVGAGGGSGPTVVQTIGSSTTDVMSQNAASRMIYVKVGNDEQYAVNIRGSSGADSSAGLGAVAVGSNTFARSDGSVALGFNAAVYAAGSYSIAIGNTAKTEGHSRAVALGNAANAAFDNSVALGSNAKPTRAGEVNVGADTSGRGYNNTNYRVIGGVHDPVDNHDAATKGYVDTAVAGAGASAFTNNEWNALWA